MQAALILFDWGETLMRNLPKFSGSMATWPNVEALPGARKTLEALAAQYTLAIASGATDSSGEMVEQALKRVGLKGLISCCFTSRDLGVTKADATFYPRIVADMGCKPAETIMIGDSYTYDVLQAQRSGLKAIWFNPSLAAVPDLAPYQNEEVAGLEELPEMIAAADLPDIPTCLAWQQEVALPENVVEHSRMVAGVAYLLAVWLRKAGERVDAVLAQRGGLLHDLDKIQTLHQGNHGQVTYSFLLERHQPELAEIALRHNLSAISDIELCPRTWEELLVFYADKLVEGHQVVPFLERCQALKGRYPAHVEDIEASIPYVLDLEAQICGLVQKTSSAMITELFRILNNK